MNILWVFIVFFFFWLQQMEAYSPISYRSHRMGMANSSIGATSVRRLLTVNRTYGCRHKIPVHVRAKITKHFVLLVLAHAITCSALVPFIGLQVSRSDIYAGNSGLNDVV
jgi:hypothetical protein